jgi:anti-anti-sigma factor
MVHEASRIGVDVGTELSAATAGRVRSLVAGAMQPGGRLELHLESVVSYDAAGLGLLVGLKRRIEAAGGHLVCVDPSAQLYAGIRRLGLHHVLDIPVDLTDTASGTVRS